MRHTDTVAFFLDNGVPADDIFDECHARALLAMNPDNIILIQERQANQHDEL